MDFLFPGRMRWADLLQWKQVIGALHILPIWQVLNAVPVVVYVTENYSIRRSSINMLSKPERIQLSKLILLSTEYSQRLGGDYARRTADILRENPFLRQILSAKGNDFLFGLMSGGYFRAEDSLQQAIVSLCYQVTWHNGEPTVKLPLCAYGSFDKLVLGFSDEQSNKNNSCWT